MTFDQIEKDVDKIIDSYCRAGVYTRYKYDENDNEKSLDEELSDFFKKNNVKFKIGEEDGVDLVGYENNFMAVAFMVNRDDGYSDLGLKTVVFEYM